jgi:hypothetical protein
MTRLATIPIRETRLKWKARRSPVAKVAAVEATKEATIHRANRGRRETSHRWRAIKMAPVAMKVS